MCAAQVGILVVPKVDKPNNKAVSKVSVTASIFLQGSGYMVDIRTNTRDDKEDLFERITYEGSKGCVDLYNPPARGKKCMELELLQEQGKVPNKKIQCLQSVLEGIRQTL